MPKAKREYHYRGRIERCRSRGYLWYDGYSETSPEGHISYPWLTKAECYAEAKRDGMKAVFIEREIFSIK